MTGREVFTDPWADPWAELRRATRARIGLGRAGAGLPTRPLLDFQEAHALARDAVHAPFDAAGVAAAVTAAAGGLPVYHLRSRAVDRATYLQRPDLGRLAEPDDLAALPPGDYDAAFIIADGLSAAAVHAHAAPLLRELLPRLAGWRIAPLVVARQARVALGDPVGQRLGAGLVAVLIGERPGLSAADSLGVYVTFAPRPGRLDSERNCISNIRPPDGLGYAAAAGQLAALLAGARRLGASGVTLKLDSNAADDRDLPPA